MNHIYQWESKQLHLHQAVDQPGNFCCDDGKCIPSQFVCDSRNHCDDNSDEIQCKMLFLGTGNLILNANMRTNPS